MSIHFLFLQLNTLKGKCNATRLDIKVHSIVLVNMPIYFDK